MLTFLVFLHKKTLLFRERQKLFILFFRQIRDVVEEGIAVDVVNKVDWAAIFGFNGTATARTGNNHVTIYHRTFDKVFFPE